MDAARVLAVNAGSSSIRFALYDMDESLRRCARGKIDRIGVSRTTLTVEGSIGARAQSYAINVRNHGGAAGALSACFHKYGNVCDRLEPCGHRVHDIRYRIYESDYLATGLKTRGSFPQSGPWGTVWCTA